MTMGFSGYAEGYYGRLLYWDERVRILDTLQASGFTTYYYAPKEDPLHRLHWREPYDRLWLSQFRNFCHQAAERRIQVVAGVAPGLDFDFSHLPGGRDFSLLLGKSAALLEHGATLVSLLMDDIDEDFSLRCGSFDNEGQAHATLANSLHNELVEAGYSTQGLWVTPRIYADELIVDAPEYLPAFSNTLHTQHRILYCGSDVVAQAVNSQHDSLCAVSAADGGLSSRSLHGQILWDNLYANDYCPRRLFLGPWCHRDGVQDVLLNPTGLVETDCLLIELMAAGMATSFYDSSDKATAWQRVFHRYGVPEQFMTLSDFFYHPVFNTSAISSLEEPGDVSRNPIESPGYAQTLEAIEECLWRWKSPLSREWYPFLFGLKHDLLSEAGEHAPLRIRKTQTAPMARLQLGKFKLSG